MRLATRLAVVVGLASLLAVVSVGALTWILARNELIEAVDRSLQDRLVRLNAIAQSAPPDASVGPDGVPSDLAVADAGIVAYDSTGAVIVGEPVLLGPDEARRIATGSSPTTSEREVDGRIYRFLSVPVPQESLRVDIDLNLVVLFEEVSSQREALDRLRLGIAGIGTVTWVALVAAGWFVGRRVARPLTDLTDAATDLARLEDVPERIEIERGDEVGRLARSFNQLISAIEIGREQQQRLVADASHELRTPLASLRMRIEYLATKDELDPDARQHFLDDAVVDLEQLSALVGELVDLAADIRGGDEETVVVELDPIIHEVAQRVRSATRRTINVETDDSVAAVRPGMFRRAVQNLVDNAVKYSPDDTAITIRLHRGSVEVADAGPGIPEGERGAVFDRFYRSPQARNRPGNGIGLAIVRQVADSHGGHTWVGTASSGGACVGFSVPVEDR